MQPAATTCTEDRIHHALERCLHGLSLGRRAAPWSAGLCLNCWSLQELVSRDPGHFLILLEQILQKTREVQEKGTYDLLAPLALLFYSTVLCTPHFPPDSDLLLKAASTYHCFLTWPVPYCSICRELLTFIDAELKAPGISYQRLVRAEQGLSIKSHRSSTVTVLLLNPVEVQAEFLAVADKLSTPGQSPHGAYVTLLLHAFQATFGARCDLPRLHRKLQSKTLEELEDIFTETAEAQELAAGIGDVAEARQWLRAKLQAVGEKAGFPGILDTANPGKLHTIPIPVARCYTYSWNQDSFDILQEILLKEQELLPPGILGDDEEEEEEEEEEEDLEIDRHSAERDSLLSTSSLGSHDSTLLLTTSHASGPTLSRQVLTTFVSGLSDGMDSGYVEDSEESSPEWTKKPGGQQRQGQRRPGQKFNRFYKLLKSTSQLVLRRDSRSLEGSADAALPLRRAGSLCSPLDCPAQLPSRAQRSRSLPQPRLSTQLPSWLLAPPSHHQRRRPFLSGDEDPKASTLRVVVFGSDRISGKVARAYSKLRRLENSHPILTRFFKLQFFYVPVKRSHGASSSACPPSLSQSSAYPTDSLRHPTLAELGVAPCEDSTNDISHYLGMLDPWYERNVLGLMHLPPEVLCQSLKAEARPLGGPAAQLPILADMLLYYCRFAARPVLLQVYQTELTFVTGEKTTEIFIQSLELGHSATTRAIKASGPGSKRLGIDDDREAVPLTLQIIYSKGAVSGRSRWSSLEKICTSANLSKACQKPEELDSSMEALTLTLTEVVKRQNPKSKKGFNQISTSHIKVDKVQIIGSSSCPFAVCLDQDERKILQSVVRCEVSPCYKPEKSSLPPQRSCGQPEEAGTDLCSLLCLPIMTFSGALP
ncbi:phosphoinositide 3-kinase regulatory subunit 5 isoform X2 [Meriones unguiculatus]|uniref:phosphoinositide 3-kinase regulatory subunit 5 isoform X2 n=1 Tax=Meriones unguiculatus TaxID=10047 RepID=UPI000B4EF142|nr:phosphoinositide 3-kinase regulatory subunit 5 isoform X2 [Meriones unguiculatus]XP_060219427.1 phosphoinositide 3-kinase regulatory subunit 5 isoform X2 [Meriones unguiculatus]